MPKSKLQKARENPRSSLWKKKADKAWAELVHMGTKCLIDNDECCGRLEAHHLISRAKVSTRHKIENACLLCTLHHKYHKTCSPHGGPIGFSEWLRVHEPEKYAWVLENQHKIDRPNYKEAYENLVEIKRLHELSPVPIDET